ncbi:MAG: DNA translocase FtsK 4TM domain-containing protein, partial [bacterium]
MNSGGKWLDIVGLLALFVVFFLGVSLLTYSPAVDPPTSSTGTINNAGGKLGAYLAHYLYLAVGPLCWFVVFLFGLFTAHLFRRHYEFLDVTSLAGWSLTFLGLAGLAAWWRPDSSHLVQSYLLSRTRPLFGPAGSLLLFTFTTIVGIALKPASILARSFSDISPLVSRLGQYGDSILNRTHSAVNWCKNLAGEVMTFTTESDQTRSVATTSQGASTATSVQAAPKTDDQSDTSAQTESDDEDDSTDSEKVLPFEKDGDPGDDKDTGDSTEDSTETSEKNERNDNDEDPSPSEDEETSATPSPEDTEKSGDSDPIEVGEDRPQVDEADMSYYDLPELGLLESGDISNTIPDDETLDATAEKLEDTFDDFGLEGNVIDASPGPVLTMYEVEPGAGVSVKKFDSRADDIKLNLAVESVRIVSPIPGKSALGIEVPNDERALVRLRDVIESDEFQDDSYRLPLGLGLDVLGNPMVVDLAELPHLLVAGATGSGKSVCLNSMICSLIYRLPPDELKFMMIDPKRVELKLYDGLPHLMTPVIDDTS